MIESTTDGSLVSLVDDTLVAALAKPLDAPSDNLLEDICTL